MTLDPAMPAPQRYASQIVAAKQYISEHHLYKKRPSHVDLQHLYVELGLPAGILSTLLGTTRLRFWLEQAGIARRTSALQKHLAYNQGFFKEWTPEMAWVLGLLFTDAHVAQGGRYIALASTDIELLEKVRALVAPQLPLRKEPQSYDETRFIYKLKIAAAPVVQDILKLGLSERKSLTMEFPDIPPALIRHFIRGCWDGDGGFTESHGTLAGHYTCGSFVFIERLRDELFSAGITRQVLAAPKRVTEADRTAWIENRAKLVEIYRNGPYPLTIHKRKSANAYDLRLGGDIQLFAFYEFLYADVPSQIYLGRKYKLLADHTRNRRSAPHLLSRSFIGNLEKT